MLKVLSHRRTSRGGGKGEGGCSPPRVKQIAKWSESGYTAASEVHSYKVVQLQLRVIFSECRESGDSHEQSIFLLFHLKHWVNLFKKKSFKVPTIYFTAKI